MAYGLLLTGLLIGPAAALEPIKLSQDADRIDLLGTQAVPYTNRGDQLQLETAPGLDGIAGRMSVTAQTSGTNPNWIVFALRNDTDKPVERWLVAERYNLVGSGIAAPDLDAGRLVQLTPSLGFVPERIPNDKADVFRITVSPGQTVTFATELTTVSGAQFPGITLWKPLIYEKKLRDRTLFNGIMVGIVGLLAIFMTAIFGANHKLIFPSMALVAWSVLAYLCVDFGFWHKIFQLPAEEYGLYRAVTEAAMAGSFVLFLYAFLRIGQWYTWLRLLFVVWIAAQVLLLFGAAIDPRFAVTLSRLSFAFTAVAGTLFILYLTFRGQDRALALAPSWMLFVVWVLGAGLATTGRLTGDIAVSGLIAGLVAILVLMSYSVTQFAFRSFEPLHALPQNALQTRSLAIDAAGSAVWEWNARKDEVHVGGMVEDVLGLAVGEASGRTDEWLKHVHPMEREKLRLSLVSIREGNGGNLSSQFRLRRSDGTYRWFELKATSVAQAEQQALMCVGLLRDVTHVKRAHEQLVKSAVMDSLTGLPNRELFLDRIGTALRRAQDETERRLTPTVLFIDLDRFKAVNKTLGLIVGDSMLLTAAKRLSRHIATQDSLGRIGGDQFAILLAADVSAQEVAVIAERVRRALRSPMKIARQDIVLTGSIGIAAFDGTQKSADDLLHEAEMAMYRAKRQGPDRIEIFKPEYRTGEDSAGLSEAELKKAIERKQFVLLYQPIVRLATDEVAGFEAIVRLDHPKLGVLTPEEFLPMAERAGLSQQLALHLATRVARDVAQWQKALPRGEEALFATVSLSKHSAFTADLVQEIKVLVGREHLSRNSLRLKLDEAAVLENAERTVELVEWLKAAGCGVTVERFGTGFSSLAHLSRLQADSYQLDQALLHDALTDPQSADLVRAIVALTRELGRTVIAEGAETQEDISFLKGINCQYAQGAWFSEPMSDKDVLEVLETIRQNAGRGERRGLFGRRKGPTTVSQPPIPQASAPTDDVPRTRRPPAPPVPPVQAGPEDLDEMDYAPVVVEARPRTRVEAPAAVPTTRSQPPVPQASALPPAAAPERLSERASEPAPRPAARDGLATRRQPAPAAIEDTVVDLAPAEDTATPIELPAAVPPPPAPPLRAAVVRTRARPAIVVAEAAPPPPPVAVPTPSPAAPVDAVPASRARRPLPAASGEAEPGHPQPMTEPARMGEGLARLVRSRDPEPAMPAAPSPGPAVHSPAPAAPAQPVVRLPGIPPTIARRPLPIPPLPPPAAPATAAVPRTSALPPLPPLPASFDAPAPTPEELLASIASMNARVRGKS